MLKRKLISTGVFTNALLVIIFTANAHELQQTKAPVMYTDSTVQWLGIDSTSLKITGLNSSNMADAPAIKLNKQATKFVKDYVKQNDEMLEKIKTYSPKYFALIDAVFAKYHLPEELKYLAVIESQLQTKAVSHVGAKGLWQLMPETARDFSLKITSRYDERTHAYKSTIAAAKYLAYLHKTFDDWLLVIAAYNSGPGYVLQAIKKSGSRNFWKLQYFLPEETRLHVKRFIGTHYYFEGDGSATTLTKYEARDHLKKIQAYVDDCNAQTKKEATNTMAADLKINNNEAMISAANLSQPVKLNEKK